ncbi:MAG: lamin tail domain-containing protein [Limisphaerales bacterium]
MIRRRSQAPWLPAEVSGLAALLFLLFAAAPAARADSVVVFNEIMYHPGTNAAGGEWLELHNQMAVDVDLSGWSITNGVAYTFPEGTVIPGGGYQVVALSPADLSAATGLTNILGPYTGHLSNSGEKLELYNRNQRQMDSVDYGVDGDWPVGPDGSGVSLAKQDEDSASGLASNWTVSALVGGSPGRRNFPTSPFEVTNSTPVGLTSTWKYQASGADLGSAWRQPAFDDSAWSAAPSPFQAGALPAILGDPESLPTVFSTGVGPDGTVLAPGSADPHYWLTLSAQSTPPPPAIPATVIQNHPAWVANDTQSSWIGSVNPGTANVNAGDYNYETTFSLAGFSLGTAALTLSVAVDNELTNVLLNGVSQPITFAGFASLSGIFTLTNGFVTGTNTLDFFTVNDDGPGPNPAGFRAELTGTGRQAITPNTTLATGQTNYYFRSTFTLSGAPQLATIQLNTAIADGAVFYLNGVEALRLNLPAGPITAATFALTNISNPAYLGPFVLPSSALVSGANVLAVEVHPAAPGTNHIFFASSLTLTVTNILVPPPIPLAFNELSSATNNDFWFELINYSATNVDLAGCVLARRGTGPDNNYLFPSQTVSPGGFVLVTQTNLGFGVSAGDRLFLYGPNYSNVLDAVVAPAAPQARWPDGQGAWSYPATLTPGASNSVVFHRDVVINEIMYHAPPLPPVPASYGSNTLISITNFWKYSALGIDLGTAWRAPGYDDSAWPDAPALFYYTPAVLPAPKNTELPLDSPTGVPIITYYFRTPFMFSGQTNSGQLTLHPIVDDGAVYYLNGLEIFRQNMPSGNIYYTNFTSVGVATPTYSGPFTVSVTNLLTGTNLFAVEVHQFTTNPIAADMAFGVEVDFLGQYSPAQPAQDSPEAWVEFFNRGSNTVDLTGWAVSGGIGFSFAPGTTLPAGGYLVLANDVGYMQSKYPGIAVVGPFTGKLSHHDDTIILTDAAGNVANQVHYYDGGRWPSYADGGGSSLELRDPWADNSQPEAWAASDETSRSSWSNYTYLAVSTNVLGPTLWNELQLGLLDAGECLLDDLQVIESPNTAPVEFLQNGSFETGLTAWRTLGNHSHSFVDTDPDNPANHVLHLVATSATETMHNHLETTYANGLSITDGKTYQVSFRAKWLAGNNYLNTRLYFNRVAQRTVLPMPSQHGTPGGPNSTLTPHLGPTFAAFSHTPIVPQPSQAVTVNASASDSAGVQALTLWWSVNGGAWQQTPMVLTAAAGPTGYANYTALIPGQTAGALVQFYVQAADNLGVSSTFPARGPDSRALFKVDDGTAIMPQLHRLRLLMTSADTALLLADTNVMSNDLLGLTVIYDERQVFYDVGVHIQSSERGRDDPTRQGFTVKVHPEQPFRGFLETVTMDRSGGYSGLGGTHDEILLWHAINHAGGLLGFECDLVQVFAPNPQLNSTAMLRISGFDGNYFDEQFPGYGNGNLYKLEIIYYPTTTLTGDPQAPKLPQPDDVVNVDIQDWGNDPENYRWVFLEENNTDIDDYSQLMTFSKSFSLTGSALQTQTAQLLDSDQWMRTLAWKAFTGDVDTFTAGLNHNFMVYFRQDNGKALGLVWDEDYSFVAPVNAAFPGTSSPGMYNIITLPDNYRRYYNHLLDLMTTTINSAHLSPWANRYAGLLGQDWSGVVNYLQQRADFIRSTMPLTTVFAITNNGGNGFATASSPIVLAGTAPLTVKDILINGVSYAITWLSLTNWTVTVPLFNYSNFLAVQGFDNYGALVTNASVSIVVTNLGAPAPRPVVFNEWMAKNNGPGGFADPADGKFSDWFELYNPNNSAADISGFYLTDDLSNPTNSQVPAGTVIPPYGFLLVWADKNTALNGSGTNGDLHVNFKLPASGMTLGFFAANGTLQHAVTFGAQLENVSQGLFPDGNTNGLYFFTNWTPRASNRLGPPPSPQLGAFVIQPDGTFTFQASAIPGRTYSVEFKDDLNAPTWTTLVTDLTSTGSQIVVTDTLVGTAQRFYRVMLVP